MARLVRLSESKEVAQLGSVLGREFAYEMIKALTSEVDATLQLHLGELVDAELLYQRGRPPHSKYTFKHALIQDSAYASLLRSTRQAYHQSVAEMLEQQFPDLVETQPELMASHYTEAGLSEQAIPYWLKAGQRAAQRSANVDGISHLNKGLEVVAGLSDTVERAHHELALQAALGPVLIAVKSWRRSTLGSPKVSAPKICRARRRCWRNWPSALPRVNVAFGHLVILRRVLASGGSLLKSRGKPLRLLSTQMANKRPSWRRANPGT
jgi:predicted ATPase